MTTAATLETRFPDYHAKDVVEHGPFRLVVLRHHHDVSRSPYQAYETEIGAEVSHRFDTSLLLAGRDGHGYAILRVAGYSSYSDRFDHEALTVSCDLDDGRRCTLYEDSHNEKYWSVLGRSKPERLVEPLLGHLRERLGYPDVEAEDVRKLISALAARFSY